MDANMITKEMLRGIKYCPKSGNLFRNPTKKQGMRFAGIIQTKDTNGYIRFRIGRFDFILGHRAALVISGHELSKHCKVDHINGIKNDNRLCNLRVVSERDNNCNLEMHRNGKLPGCYFVKGRNKWISQIKQKGIHTYLGYFNTEKEAHERYLKELKDRRLNASIPFQALGRKTK